MDIYLLIDGQQQGPYTEDQVRQSLAEGLIPDDLPAWHDGLPEWVQVKNLVELFSKTQSDHRVLMDDAFKKLQHSEFGSDTTPDLKLTDPAEQKPNNSESKSVKTGLAMGVKIGVFIGLVLSVLSGGIIFALVGLHYPPTRTQEAVSTTSVKLLAVPKSHPALDDTPAQPTESNISTTSDQAKQWLKDKIEAFGGGTVTYTEGLGVTTYYQTVSFEGDTLSFWLGQDFSNGKSHSYKEKINLDLIRQGSFRYVSDDHLNPRFTPIFSSCNPRIEYIIHFSQAGHGDAIWTENNESYYPIKIKDEDIAKRIVELLNLLTTQTNAHSELVSETTTTSQTIALLPWQQ